MEENAESLPEKVSAEDALRLDNLMMRKQLVEQEFSAQVSDLAGQFNEAWASVQSRYKLGEKDSVDLRSGEIKRVG